MLEMRRKEEIEKTSTFCLIATISPEEKSNQEISLLYKGQSKIESLFSLERASDGSNDFPGNTVEMEHERRSLIRLASHTIFGILAMFNVILSGDAMDH
jgi:hypothetical protein